MLLAAVLLVLPLRSLALSSCVAFDINWNLLLFGLDGKDYSAGDVSTWDSAGSTPTDISASGRPPFSSANVHCYLSQFTNAIYVLNADISNPSDLYIYDVGSSSWSTQKVNAGSFDPSSALAILDHDTNVFYALSQSDMYALNMDLMVKANETALEWVNTQKAGINTDGYSPVMAIAKNHVHFLGVPGLETGTDSIFVIHFAYFQPEVQSYGSNWPTMHGQASSFFLQEGVQKEYAFVPDDFSSTYIANVDSNTTKVFPAPTASSSNPTDFALFGTPSSLVYLTSSSISYLPYTSETTSSEWKILNSLNSLVASVASRSTNNSTGGSSASPTGSAGGPSSDSDSSSDENSAQGLCASPRIWIGLAVSLLLGSFGVATL